MPRSREGLTAGKSAPTRKRPNRARNRAKPKPSAHLSGQVFMAAADVAMWLAIMTKLGQQEAAVTVP